MALWSIKKIEGPLPQVVSGTVALKVTVIDKDTGIQEVTLVNATESGDGYDITDMLTAVEDDGYTPNDFGL